MRVLELFPLTCLEEKENRVGDDANGEFNCQRLVEELKLNLTVNA
jgi:hypothetical protein